MKRDRLIPVEKSKKVIYLDPRGRGVDQKHYGAMALYVLAVLCALYCVGIGLFVGFGSYFFLIWGAIAAFCAAWGWILTHKSVQERIPRWIRMTFCGLVAAGILLLLILEGMIFGQFGACLLYTSPMIQIMAGTPQMKLLTTLLTASIVDNIDEISYHLWI